jgi:HEAT repeat protein
VKHHNFRSGGLTPLRGVVGIGVTVCAVGHVCEFQDSVGSIGVVNSNVSKSGRTHVTHLHVVGALTALAVLWSGLSTVHAKKKVQVVDLVAALKKCESLENCAAVEALVKRKKSFWPALSVGLSDSDEMIRFWTLGVLSKAPTKQAIPAIGERLDDPKIRVRAAAAYALGALQSKEVLPHLLKAVGDKDLNVRFAAVVAMGRVRDPALVPALIKACRDRDEDVRAYAVLALGDIGDVKSLPRLHERLEQDVNGKVRAFVASALAQFKSKTSLEPLINRMRDEKDAKSLAAAIYALGELAEPSAAASIALHAKHEDETVRQYVADALKKLGFSDKSESQKE